MTDCPSRFTIARLCAGDLPPDELAEVREHVEGCDRCRDTLAEIDANAAEYHARADEHLAGLRARLEAEQRTATVVPIRAAPRSRVTKVAIALGGLAAAALVALILLPLLLQTDGGDPTGDIRFKGRLAVEVIAKRGTDQFRVTDGSELEADDALRFVVSTGAAGWASVFSLDASGSVSPFYPDSDPAADPRPLRIPDSGRHELPGSIILDDSTGHEDIAIVFSRERFERAPVHRTIAGAAGADEAQAALGSDFSLMIVGVVKTPH
jgi:hypothetical protein